MFNLVCIWFFKREREKSFLMIQMMIILIFKYSNDGFFLLLIQSTVLCI